MNWSCCHEGVSAYHRSHGCSSVDARHPATHPARARCDYAGRGGRQPVVVSRHAVHPAHRGWDDEKGEVMNIDVSHMKFTDIREDSILLSVVDRGAPYPGMVYLRPWLAYRTDLRWVDAIIERYHGGISEVECILYPDGKLEQTSISHIIAWRIDKRATHMQPLTYPGQLKPLVIDLREPVQFEMF